MSEPAFIKNIKIAGKIILPFSLYKYLHTFAPVIIGLNDGFYLQLKQPLSPPDNQPETIKNILIRYPVIRIFAPHNLIT
jgi:hypothetical protein